MLGVLEGLARGARSGKEKFVVADSQPVQSAIHQAQLCCRRGSGAEISCASLLKLERYARIHLGVRIILPWEEIRERCHETNEAISPRTPKEAERRGPHCAIGRILYEDGSYGILLYFKSSLSGDEKDYVLDYKKRNSDFPHENTSDQFFTEEQFEVYRSLGYHVVEGFFSGTDEVSVLMDGPRAWADVNAAGPK